MLWFKSLGFLRSQADGQIWPLLIYFQAPFPTPSRAVLTLGTRARDAACFFPGICGSRMHWEGVLKGEHLWNWSDGWVERQGGRGKGSKADISKRSAASRTLSWSWASCGRRVEISVLLHC